MVHPRSAPLLLGVYPRYKHFCSNNLAGSRENRLNGKADACKNGPWRDLCLGEIQGRQATLVPTLELRPTHVISLYVHQVAQLWQGSPCPSDAIAVFGGDLSHI